MESSADRAAAVTLVRALDALATAEAKADPAPTAEPPSEPAFQTLDRAVRAAVAQVTFGLSPAALAGAFFDWFVHLALSPGKQIDLVRRAIAHGADHCAFTAQSALHLDANACARALPHDDRFRAPAWQTFPFNVYAHSFLSLERWWETATTDVRGVSQRHDQMVEVVLRNGRVLRLSDGVVPGRLAQLADVLQEGLR
jgi:polyhydroxyalkanoate synthase subunit PhaC